MILALAWASGLASSEPAATQGRRLTVDVVSRKDPEGLLLSDDGKMAYAVLGEGRRAFLPNGPRVEGDGLKFQVGEPGTLYTDSQISHLRAAGRIAYARGAALASPRPNRVLFGGGRLTLIRYEARGRRCNPSIPWPESGMRLVRALGEGAYLFSGGRRSGGRAMLYRVETKGDRLAARRLGWRRHMDPAALPPGARGTNPRREDGERTAISGDGGKGYTLLEWSARLRRWRAFPPPVAEVYGSLSYAPRLVSLSDRLFAMPFRMGGPGHSWTYEANPGRKSWRKVSDRTLLTVSANGEYCLTLDANKGEAWLERFADFAGKG